MSRFNCPKCGSANTCRIMYGLPDLTEKLDEDLKNGKVYLGGCIVSIDDPNRHCNICNLDFDTKKSKYST